MAERSQATEQRKNPSKYIATRDCFYKGRFFKCGEVLQTDEKVSNPSFKAYEEGYEPLKLKMYNPTGRLVTERKIQTLTAGIPERN